MIILRTIPELRTFVHDWQGQGLRIGLVPTMGYLHAGHLSLIDHVRPRCDRLIVSIFVNPTQFAPGEDLDRYPRNIERDEQAVAAHGTDAIFYPDAPEMYPEGFRTFTIVEGLGDVLCGRTRPTHFRGVTTVVSKLFNLTRCQVAAFGQKDYQQSLIIRRMAADLNYDVDVLVCSTVREEDGLAMSSRNSYLSPEERERAVCLYRALTKGQKLFSLGERSAAKIRQEMKRTIQATPGVSIDYLEAVDAYNLQPLEKIDRPAVLAGAVYVGATRLIDNVIIEP
ncbi:MAG: pantoate--beta-alanine ligase [Candidatus Zixiibacteriota bacterium]|nr:MAG: pantoate--beta-alanine ligase [candidate division Zixibacteria bacterium]